VPKTAAGAAAANVLSTELLRLRGLARTLGRGIEVFDVPEVLFPAPARARFNTARNTVLTDVGFGGKVPEAQRVGDTKAARELGIAPLLTVDSVGQALDATEALLTRWNALGKMKRRSRGPLVALGVGLGLTAVVAASRNKE